MIRWIQTSKTLVEKFRIFTIFNIGFRSETSSREGLFTVLELNDWVHVIPITHDGKAIMVKQFRYGTAAVTLEFPGGVIEEGQTPEEAAARELVEETGASFTNLKTLGKCHPNPAFQNNQCHFFVATGIQREKEQSLDEHEEIEIVLVPLAEIDRKIAGGEITHAITISAWHFYSKSR